MTRRSPVQTIKNLRRKRRKSLQARLLRAGSEVRGQIPALSNDARAKGAEIGKEIARQYAKMDVSWARGKSAGLVRGGILAGILAPLLLMYVKRRVDGREVLGAEMTDPVIFVANHSSHLDTPTILRAIPPNWRKRTAVAAAADYFYKSRWRAWSAALVFNTVPMGRTGGGLSSGASDHVHELIAEGWNLLIFPEGTRSRDGEIGKVKSGAAVLAGQHGLNIVPIWVGGTHEAMPPGQNWPKRLRGRFFSRRVKVEVRFGPPIPPRDPSERREVMAQVQDFWEREGRPESGEPPSAHDVLNMHAALRAREREAAEPADDHTAADV
jgi:1-acyl-sn-glycerol-3-phosphate acyltransferase